LGFDFLGDIIWQKVSTTNTTGGCSLMGSIYYPRNGLLTYDYEHILIFKKHKGKKTKVKRKRKELSKISLSEWKKWYVGHWRFPGVIQKEHIAMFPEELPYRIIRMFSFVGDNVLDPFTGSGTTLKVAKSLARKGIGYEINEDFNDIINEKTNNAKLGNFQDYQYLLYRIYQKTSNGESEICFQEQNRKGILILKRGEKKIILDYLLIDLQELSKNQIDKQILNKLEENSVQHYLKQKKKWKDFDNYIITINSLSDKSTDFSSEKRFEKNGEDNKLARKIQEVLESHQKKDTFKFEKPLSFLFYQTIISKSCDLKELFKENRNILQFGDALRSKNNNRKNSNLEDFLS